MAFRDLEERIRQILKRLGEMQTALNGKAASSHTHTTNQITSFTSQTQSAVRSATWLPYATSAGTVTITGTGAQTADATVTFPSSRFSVAPIITTSQVTSSANAPFTARIISKSATGFTLRLAAHTGAYTGTYSIDWTATQMTSGAANG